MAIKGAVFSLSVAVVRACFNLHVLRIIGFLAVTSCVVTSRHCNFLLGRGFVLCVQAQVALERP